RHAVRRGGVPAGGRGVLGPELRRLPPGVGAARGGRGRRLERPGRPARPSGRSAGTSTVFVGWVESSRPTGSRIGGPRRLDPPYEEGPGPLDILTIARSTPCQRRRPVTTTLDRPEAPRATRLEEKLVGYLQDAHALEQN